MSSAAKSASRKAKKTRQKERRAKEAGERAASEAERAEPPRAQLRENIQYVMAGLRTAAAQARSQSVQQCRPGPLLGSNTRCPLNRRPCA